MYLDAEESKVPNRNIPYQLTALGFLRTDTIHVHYLARSTSYSIHTSIVCFSGR